jgi:hypothetical protein
MYGAASASPYDSARVTLRGNRHEIYHWLLRTYIRKVMFIEVCNACYHGFPQLIFAISFIGNSLWLAIFLVQLLESALKPDV